MTLLRKNEKYREDYPHVKGLDNIFAKFSPIENYHVYSTLYRDRKIRPHVKEFQSPRLSKPRLGLQIFETWVDFPVPVQNCGRFLVSICYFKR